MQNKIRKIIKEILGHYLPIDVIAEKLAKKAMKECYKEQKEIGRKLNFHDTLSFFKEFNKEDEGNIGIWQLKVNIFVYDKTDKQINNVSGQFSLHETKQYVIENEIKYYIEMKIYLNNWDGFKDLSIQLKKIFLTLLQS